MFAQPVARARSAGPKRAPVAASHPRSAQVAKSTPTNRLQNDDTAAKSHMQPAAPRLPRFMQASLKLGAQSDSMERDAHRIAEHVTRTPASNSPTGFAVASLSGRQEQGHQVAAEQRLAPLQQDPVIVAPPIVQEVLRSTGRPLDSATRAYFEPRFGRNFSGVRVHTGLHAGLSARAINANAYTSGANIVFAPGRFEPATEGGRRLLAHELAHVVQQSSRYGAASGRGLQPLGVTSSPGIIQRDTSGTSPFMSPENLVDAYRPHMMSDHFEQATQALFINFSFRGFDAYYVLEVMKKLPDEWEDNVAALFTEMLTDPVLNTIARNHYGRGMLTVLYEAMITGSVSDFERQQSDRIINAKTSQMKPEDFLASEKHRPSGERTEIFPVRFMRITPGYDDAPLMAELTDDGKIRVEYPTRVKYASKFAAEVGTLPDDVFLSSGQILGPGEIVGIKDYESGGTTIFRPALVLIDYSNRVKHSTLGKIAQVSIAAATMGLGGPAVGAGEAGAEQTGVWAARLALADKIAGVAQVVSFFIGENRDWLIDNFGPVGRFLVRTSEIADSIIAVYGIGRLGHAGFKIAKDLRTASKAAKARADTLFNADLEDLAKLDKIDAATENLAREIEEARAAQPEIFAEDKPPGAGGASPSAELNVPGPHPFFKKPPANDNALFPDLEAEAAEIPLAATGTGDVIPAKTVGEVKRASHTGPDPIQMSKKSPQNQNLQPTTPATPTHVGPARSVEEFERSGRTVKKGPKIETPEGVTAQPKDPSFEKRRSERLGSADEAPEIKAVQESKTPKGLPQPKGISVGNFAHNDLPRYLAHFRETRDLENAEALEHVLNWPHGVEPNFRSFEMPDGRMGIPDGIDPRTGAVYELKPDTGTAWAKGGPHEAREYADQLNRERYLGRNDWHGVPITYSSEALRDLLEDWGFLTR